MSESPDRFANFDYLLRLLDDESEEIQRILRGELLSHSLELVLRQESLLRNLSDEDRINLLAKLRAIHEDLVYEAFRQVIAQSLDEIDLEKGVLILSYWDAPEISAQMLSSRLDQFADEVSGNMPRSGHPLGFIDHMNHIMFDKYFFRGNARDYYNPNNSFLHKVLETGLGLPITLSIVYMLVSRRLNFPVFGVSMPAHFILKFDNGEDQIFFDPFYRGKIYSYKTCLEYLKDIDQEAAEKILNGCNNTEIIARTLGNLKVSYSSHTLSNYRLRAVEKFASLFQSAI